MTEQILLLGSQMVEIRSRREKVVLSTTGIRCRSEVRQPPTLPTVRDAFFWHRFRPLKRQDAHYALQEFVAFRRETAQAYPAADSVAYLQIQPAWSSILAHLDFCAVEFVLHFIHQRIDQKNSAAVIGENILLIRRARDLRRVKAFPRIAHHDKDSAVLIGRYRALDSLGRIRVAPMQHGGRH